MAIRIMIVEDREPILAVVDELLNGAGYQVVFKACSGEAAIKGYQEARPDLVLMDLVLPDMNGLEVTRRIMDMDPSARIIALTALSKEGIKEECIKAGCRRFLFKPFRMRELMRTIEDVMLEAV